MSVLLIDRPAEGVARLTLNRPEKRNALNVELREALTAALRDLDADDKIRCLVLAGAGPSFCAGADLSDMAQQAAPDARSPLWTALDTLQKPIIAAVHGHAMGGGCELAMACDLVVAARGAVFALPEVKLGIMPGAGGAARLLRLAGPQRALRWLLTGETFPAATAVELGIVSELVEDDEVAARAVALAAKVAAAPPPSVREIKALARAAFDVPLEAALTLEHEAFLRLRAGAEFHEGVSAFFEKRTPR